MELNAHTAVDGTTIDADLCIVGAGPVGLALADALRGSGLQLAIVESGGTERDSGADELNAGDAIGDRYADLQLSRSRGAGGTATIWNTLVRGANGAKYVPLDAIDFTRREWVPWSGWPFGRDCLDPYYRGAHVVCGLGAFDYAATTWCGDQPLLDMGGGALTSGVFQCGPAAVFQRAIWSRLVASPSVQVIHGATVTRMIRAAAGDRIAGVRWDSAAGGSGVVRAQRFVLAAGGIENARMLLLLARADGRDASDWTGRGFMEHPIDRSLVLASTAPALAGESSFYYPHAVEGTPAVMGRIALSADLLRELKVPSASVRLLEPEGPRLLRSAAPRSVARRLVPFPMARRTIGNAIRSVAAVRNRLRGTKYPLLIDLEQLPHRDNRVVLSGKADRFGQPRAELHWRWRSEDEAHRVRTRAAIVRELARAGVGRATVDLRRPLDPHAHHHAGTTRMHPDPAKGVVDATLRVHGEENLYVVGSSVFPTAGFANPTLTAVALALRLAEQLGRSPQRRPIDVVYRT